MHGPIIKSVYLHTNSEKGLIIERTELKNPKKLVIAKNGVINMFATIE